MDVTGQTRTAVARWPMLSADSSAQLGSERLVGLLSGADEMAAVPLGSDA